MYLHAARIVAAKKSRPGTGKNAELSSLLDVEG